MSASLTTAPPVPSGQLTPAPVQIPQAEYDLLFASHSASYVSSGRSAYIASSGMSWILNSGAYSNKTGTQRFIHSWSPSPSVSHVRLVDGTTTRVVEQGRFMPPLVLICMMSFMYLHFL